jgi:hypothetical protein
VLARAPFIPTISFFTIYVYYGTGCGTFISFDPIMLMGVVAASVCLFGVFMHAAVPFRFSTSCLAKRNNDAVIFEHCFRFHPSHGWLVGARTFVRDFPFVRSCT